MFNKLLKFRLCIGSSRLLIGTGNRSIGRLPVLGVEGVSLSLDLLPVMGIFNISVIIREDDLRR